LTEARAAARVDSANVARVVDVGTLAGSGLPYMVMERLDGCDLEELLRLEKQLSVGDTVDYTLQALQGLAHAHVLGIVHRDLKPANIFLAHQQDGTSIIKILDFGIAKLDKTTRITEHGQAVGSPTYMSPEHIRASEFVDHRTDIWSMGVVMYQLLTGRPPIEEDGVGETIAAVLNKKPPHARELRPDIPAELDAAIMKCLEHDPANRWPDVSHLARAIAPFGTGACSALVETIEQTLRQELRRYSGQAIVLKPTGVIAGARAAAMAGTSSEVAVKVDVASVTQAALADPSSIDLPPPQFVARRSRWWMVLVAMVAAGATIGVLFNAHVLALPASLTPSTAASTTEDPSGSASVSSAIASASASAPIVHHRSNGAPSTHASTKKH
jgi:serine/threonine-protein kinase